MKKQKFAVLLMVVLALVMGTSGVYAIFRTIDTDDTVLDPNWQSSPYISDDPEESASGGVNALPVDMDIQHAWLASDETSLYFRLQMYNEVTAMDGEIREAWAQIDCDMNGSVNGAIDRWVIYQFQLDSGDGVTPNVVYVRPGNSGIPTALYDDTYGERPVAPDDDNIEWKVDLVNLGPDCQNNIRVQFHTDNQTDENDDTTVLGPPFGVPMAVSLQSFSAGTSSSLPVYGLIGFAGLAMVGVVALVLRRERKQA